MVQFHMLTIFFSIRAHSTERVNKGCVDGQFTKEIETHSSCPCGHEILGREIVADSHTPTQIATHRDNVKTITSLGDHSTKSRKRALVGVPI